MTKGQEMSPAYDDSAEASKPCETSDGKETPSILEQGKSKEQTVPWSVFVRNAQDTEISQRAIEELDNLINNDPVACNYCLLALLEPDDSISTYELDYVYRALTGLNPNKEKDVLLMLLSRGGSIESAYQISKLCKSFSKKRFIVTVPRQAKSAATLIALGADEIHMGPLGQLGPIDPQLGGLPALGVAQALETIATLSEKHPGSAEMFARYLRMALTVEQIGYCDRISASAIQYAERLLSTKHFTPEKVSMMAKELVHEYKDHGFVIDIEEARQHLGNDWILTETKELALAEKVYDLFDMVNLFLNVYANKRMMIIGRLDNGVKIFINQRN